jgi:membrane protease YdiL (CAAX protease family)
MNPADVRTRTIRNLTIFTVSIIVAGWIGAWLDSVSDSSPGEGPGILLWLVSPLAVSSLLRWRAGDGWYDMGIPPMFARNAWWYTTSILAYPATIAIVLIAGCVTGVISFPHTNTLELLIRGFATGLIAGLVKNIFEEFAWRGYLAPRLSSLGLNAFTGHVIVGLIWGVWHLPYLSFVMSYVSEGAVTLIPRFLLGTVAVSILYGEIRLLTNSVWPAVIMHTVGGACIGAFYTGGVMDISAVTVFSPGVAGFLSMIILALMGTVLYFIRVRYTGRTT